MDEAAESLAGDALYVVVRKCAHAAFREFRPNAQPNDIVVMGTGPGTYEFSGVEMRTYCRRAITLVNDDLGSVFVLDRPVKSAWTYRETVHQLWDNCRTQMVTGVRIFEAMI